jgi:hypothetical protein
MKYKEFFLDCLKKESSSFKENSSVTDTMVVKDIEVFKELSIRSMYNSFVLGFEYCNKLNKEK